MEPVELAPETREWQGEPVPYNRTPEFSQLVKEAECYLKRLFGTVGRVAILTASGTGAVEAALVNLISPGDRVVVVTGGTFGGRWAELSRLLGAKVHEVAPPHLQPVHPDEVEQAVVTHGAGLLILTAHETSNGVLHPVAELARVAKRHGCRVFVDAIGALLADEFEMDAWGIDMAVASCAAERLGGVG